MGITAKGAWISVQRHFLEMGIDVQTDPITVAGCGDMSGDVFGNGMLLSKAIKLVAAFDHRHIFIDPNPDPAKSWAERKRLFELPRSSWDDYDRKKLISKGGGVFPRTEKSIPLSAEAREALGIDAKALDPASLINAILKSAGRPALVRRHRHLHQGVGAEPGRRRRSRPTTRSASSANELRAKVIGEGANLGITQAGRIEFAEHGGRINTDFIDNSAGVDCSDNEVNIKIPLNREMREGRLAFDKRNSLLVEDDRRRRRARARGQSAADAGAVDRRSGRRAGAAGPRPDDRAARSVGPARPQGRGARHRARSCSAAARRIAA